MPERRATVARDPAEPALPGVVAADTPRDRVPVLLPLPLGGTYDYKRPDDLALEPGAIVQVPLGQRDVIGVVWDGAGDPETVSAKRLRPVSQRYDVPPLSALHRRFIDWVAAYTMAEPGTVLRTALAGGRGLTPPRLIAAVRLPEAGASEAALEGLRLTPARRRVLAEAADGLARPAAELARAAGVSTAVVKGLLEARVLEAVSLPAESGTEAPDWRRKGPKLSTQQAAAAEALRERVRTAAAATEAEAGFSVTLLDGVTGSGKTEVYHEAIAEALAADRQILVLLPEIALTAQWLDRFGRALRRAADRMAFRPRARPATAGLARRRLRSCQRRGRRALRAVPAVRPARPDRRRRRARGGLQTGGRCLLPRPRHGGRPGAARGPAGGPGLGDALPGERHERPRRPLRPPGAAATPRRGRHAKGRPGRSAAPRATPHRGSRPELSLRAAARRPEKDLRSRRAGHAVLEPARLCPADALSALRPSPGLSELHGLVGRAPP